MRYAVSCPGWCSGVLVLAAMFAVPAAAESPPEVQKAEADEAAAQAAEALERLYGKDVARVRGTREADDDVALARRLLAAAREATATPALLTVLCEKACDLAAAHPSGYTTAVEAAEFLASQVPAKAVASAEWVAEVRQKQYAAAEGGAKAAAGEALIDSLLALAEAHVAAGAYPQAIAALKKAGGIARPVKSPNLAAIEAREERARFLLRTRQDIANMKALLARDPANTAAREKLVRLYLVHLDDPAAAATHLEGVEDEALQKYVMAVGKGVAAAPELACVELGDWYRGLGESAPKPARRAMFERAKAYYDRFLSLHEAEDLERTTATLAMKKVKANLSQLAPAEAPAVAGETTTPSTAEPAETAAVPKGDIVKPGEWVDLLPLVDPQKDAVEGNWVQTNAGLTAVPKGGPSRLAIPVALEGSYVLEARFVRTKGETDINFTLPVGRTGVTAAFGQGKHSALELVDGKRPDENGTSVPVWLENGRVYRALIQVMVSGDEAAITVSLNGKGIIRWRGPQSALSVHPPWKVPDARCLGLVTWRSVATFGRIRLRMLSGEARLLRPGGGAPAPSTPEPAETAAVPKGDVVKPGQWVDLLPLMDPARHAVRGGWEAREDGIALTKADGACRLTLPAAPMGEYDLEVTFARTWGDHAIVTVLPVGTTGVAVVLNDDHGACDGLDALDGKGPAANETRTAPVRLRDGRDVTLHASVRSAGGGVRIEVTVDGRPHLAWQGPASRLSVGKRWKLPDERFLGLGAHFTRVDWKRVRLKMHSGEACLLRPKAKPTPAAAGVNGFLRGGPKAALDVGRGVSPGILLHRRDVRPGLHIGEAVTAPGPSSGRFPRL